MRTPAATSPSLPAVLLAFAAVYVIWGSTYLAIRFGIETIPPFLMAGMRFVAAGTALFGWAALRGAQRPNSKHWRSAVILGGLMLVGGNGLVTWAELHVPSGVAALIVATVPLWMVVLEALRPGGARPSPRAIVGLLLGLAAIAILVGPQQLDHTSIDPVGAGVICLASFLWALGSIYSRHAPQTPSTIQNVGMQMLAGGAALLLFGFAAGERLDLSSVSASSAWALLYLAVRGRHRQLLRLRVAAEGLHARTRFDVRLRQSGHRRAAGMGVGGREPRTARAVGGCHGRHRRRLDHVAAQTACATRRRRQHPMSRHLIAAPIYDGLLAFEYSLACEILGLDRRELTPDWYEFLPCRVEAGRLRSNQGFVVQPTGTMADLARADTILVAGWRKPLERPKEPFLDALREAAARGTRLVTICTGAFALAHAGLLDGRRATTHWLHADRLREAFPRIDVQEDKLYLHDNRRGTKISTSAGSAAGLDLCLAIVREDFGTAIANKIARRMVAPVHRDGGQSQYVEAPTGTLQADQFGPVLDWIVANLARPLTLDKIAKQFGYSPRTFQRRFRELTGISPHQWLVQQRVAKARELLESTNASIERIATLSGLGSAANLRKHLAQQLGTTPRAYRSAFRA